MTFMKEKLKILYVLDAYYPFVGGLTGGFKVLAESLAASGHDVSVITQRFEEMKPFEVVNGVKVYRVSSPIKNRFIAGLFMLPLIIEKGRDADIIHTSTYGTMISCWIAKWFVKKPILITVHEVLQDMWDEIYKQPKAFAAKIFERALLALNFDYYVVHSDFVKEKLAKLKPKNKIRRIYCTANYEYFDVRKARPQVARRELGIKDEFIFAYFGRPGVTKGYQYFIKAIDKIVESVKDAKFLLVLSKEPEEGYKNALELVSKCKAKDRIIVHDPVPLISKGPCLRDYMAAADCIVVPSLSEGFGLVVAEACALGRPVVASNAGSIPEIISGKYILVRPKDPDAIADACISVARGNYKKSKKKFFTAEKKATEHLKLYKEILEERSFNKQQLRLSC